jgi:hypothetical protein
MYKGALQAVGSVLFPVLLYATKWRAQVMII